MRLLLLLSLMIHIPGLKNADALVAEAWSIGLRPPPDVTLDQWMDKHFVLGSKEPEPGLWRTHRTPYLREPMQCLSPSSPVTDLAVMKGSQLGFTKMLLGWIAFIVDQAPAETIVCLPDMKATKTWSKRQLKPMLEDNQQATHSIRSARERDSGNTQFLMEFKGCALHMTWSSSAAGLKSTSAPNAIGDEIDSWVMDCEGEGDPVTMLGRRLKNFHNRKFPKISTPAEAPSRIDKLFREGDQRRYFLPCPHCQHYQVLQLANFSYAPETAKHRDDIESAWFTCVGCGEHIGEATKADWYDTESAQGVWIPTRDRPELTSEGFQAAQLEALLAEKAASFTESPSFHLPTFYAPLGWTGSSWLAIAGDWIEAKADPMKEKTFITQILGEPVEVKGEMPDYRAIESKAEDQIELEAPFDGALVARRIPAGGLVLTCAVDVQRDYIEGEIRAWGPRRESWSVAHFQIAGDTRDESLWLQLGEQFLDRTYPHALGGELPIHIMAIDCGFQPEGVYRFAKRYAKPIYSPQMVSIPAVRTVIPIRGGHNHYRLYEGHSNVDQARKHGNIRVVTFSSHLGKLAVYDRIRLERGASDELPPIGYIHFPRYDRHFFQSITAEKLIAKSNGTLDWVKEYPRNEVLDVCAYQEGLAEMLGLDTWSESRWADRRAAVTRTAASPTRAPAVDEPESRDFGAFTNLADDPFLR
jgi:phage terminase large subunit GpA-like protein